MLKKLINSVTKPNITQKVVDAVVDGSANALKAATQKGIEKTASVITARSGFDKKKNRQAVKEAVNKIVVGKGFALAFASHSKPNFYRSRKLS